MASLRLYNCTATYGSAKECVSMLGDNSESGRPNPWDAVLKIVDFRGRATDEVEDHEVHRYYTIRPANFPRDHNVVKSILSEQTRNLERVNAKPADGTRKRSPVTSDEQTLLLCWILVDGADDQHAFAHRVRTVPQELRHPNPTPLGKSTVSVPGHDGYYVNFEDIPKPELEECVVGLVSIQPSKGGPQTGDTIGNSRRSARSLSRLFSRLQVRKHSHKYNDGPSCELMRLYVKQEHHRCLEYAMVDTVITTAIGMGFATMFLNPTPARGLGYAKEIFENAGPDPSMALAAIPSQENHNGMSLPSPNPSAVRKTFLKYGDSDDTEAFEMVLAQWPGPLDTNTAAKLLRRKRQQEDERERETGGHTLKPRETGVQRGRSSFFTNLTGPYEYTPLDEDAHEVRILELIPGPPDSEIRISLSNMELYQSGFSMVLKYEALSYSWGSTDDPVSIFIGRGRETIQVTRSLAEALLHLRDRDEPRSLWIDAICVDQANLLEKGSQIKRMADIYQKAHRVIVWLGPGLPECREAMKILSKIGSLVNVNWYGHTVEDCHEPLLGSPDVDSTYGCVGMNSSFRFSESEFSCLLDLLSRSWFERLWIWQEVRLVSAEPIVQCGFDSMLWTPFSNAIFLLRHGKIAVDFMTKGNGNSLFDNRIELAYRVCDIGVEDPRSLFEMTRLSKCSDPKDRVYALLSLFDESGIELKIEPDYTKTMYEVYRDATLRLLLDLGKLDILASSEWQEENDTESKNSWNTWVPDWSKPRSTKTVSHAFAAHLSHAEISHHDHKILVAGIALSEVCSFCTFDPAALHPQRLSDVEPVEERNKATRYNLLRIIKYFEREQRLTPSDIASLCRTLIAGEDTNNADAEGLTSSVSYIAMWDIVDSLFVTLQTVSPLEAPNEHEEHVFTHMLSYCEGRLIFRLQNGSFGFVPGAAREGDVVAVFLGCDYPLVLRPTGSSYQIVGEAYCDGSMNGEALLGPLPTNETRILQYNGETGPFIRNALKTGELVLADPRLGGLRLLPGWKKPTPDSEPLQAYGVYRNRNDEDESFFEHDYGLTSSWLRERGVVVETFEIL